jgi:hypothetical protein
MVTNSLKAAIDRYNQILKETTMSYERSLRDAEFELRNSMGGLAQNAIPPGEDTVTMSRKDFDELQEHLEKVRAFVSDNPTAE